MNLRNHKSFFLFNLKIKRIFEWYCDLRAEKPGLSEFYLMAKLLLRAALSGRTREIARKNYFRRLLLCHRCPVYDPRLKRCRQGEKGCGCYVPFKALAPVDCWIRETDKNLGWGKNDYNPNISEEFAKIITEFKEIDKQVKIVRYLEGKNKK